MKKLALLRSAAFFAVPMAVAAVVPTVAQAQQITTAIVGQVTNEAGAPIAGAQVVVTDTRTGAAREITTDQQGSFTATNLSTGGPYTVTATAPRLPGPDRRRRQHHPAGRDPADLRAVAGRRRRPRAAPSSSPAQRARVTQLEVGPGTSFSTEVLEAAPTFNRDVRDVIRIDPRVSLDREDSATGGSGADRISCLGGNDRGNSFTVDGIAPGRHLRPQRHRLLVAQLDPDPL